MLRREKHITLQETIDSLRPDKNVRKKRAKRKIIAIILLLLVVYLFPGYLIYIEGAICLVSLIQWVWSRKRTEKKKKRKQDAVRILPLVILAIYFELIGMVFITYGCMYYVFHLPVQWFPVLDWLEKSMVIFLLFEIIAIQLNRKRGK